MYAGGSTVIWSMLIEAAPILWASLKKPHTGNVGRKKILLLYIVTRLEHCPLREKGSVSERAIAGDYSQPPQQLLETVGNSVFYAAHAEAI
jgi:hypothetical protein